MIWNKNNIFIVVLNGLAVALIISPGTVLGYSGIDGTTNHVRNVAETNMLDKPDLIIWPGLIGDNIYENCGSVVFSFF